MKIGELSRLTGVSVRALCYYEEERLIRPARSGNGYRHFSHGAVEVVRQIRGLIECGLPTQIIRDVLPYLDCPPKGALKVHHARHYLPPLASFGYCSPAFRRA
ncbi:MerR family transcriptional regulator [Micromonospora sp. NPDC049523]|uniref:MerR family transcriptional regulator n=1 Tax=Micromonospora sp. NPDC049523 TaxID=3155921 RepID=UPI00343C4CBE